MKRFSFIMPVYGDAYKNLEGSVRYIQDQDWDQWEIKIVMDGPNKEAWDFLRKMEKEKKWWPTKKIEAFEVEWGGAPHARNAGAAKADGDYLMFIDPDVYLHAGSVRELAEALEDHPECDFVYGDYEIIGGMEIRGMPFNLRALQSTNYISGAYPMKREVFKGWDPKIKSLQDWDMWLTIAEAGSKGFYINKSFFITEKPGRPDGKGISDDSSKNWVERYNYVREKHGITKRNTDIVVSSLGAPEHGLHAAEKLDCDFLVMPSFKPNSYKKVYLLGFYLSAAHDHIAVFGKPGDPGVMEYINNPKKGGQNSSLIFPGFTKAKKIIHWIGTDIFQIRRSVGFEQLKVIREMFKKNKFIHLVECESTRKELAEIGIKAKVVPIPPKRLFDPMPLPEKFTVGVYTNPTQDMYYEELMADVARSMPDIDFKFFGDESKRGFKEKNIEQMGWVVMKDFLPTISCLARVTVHDGLPLGPVEAFSAGRSVVTNVDLKYAIPTKVGREEIIQAIRKAQETPIDPDAAKYWKELMSFDKYVQAIEAL